MPHKQAKEHQLHLDFWPLPSILVAKPKGSNWINATGFDPVLPRLPGGQSKKGFRRQIRQLLLTFAWAMGEICVINYELWIMVVAPLVSHGGDELNLQRCSWNSDSLKSFEWLHFFGSF
jgi:hypothetical protein